VIQQPHKWAERGEGSLDPNIVAKENFMATNLENHSLSLCVRNNFIPGGLVSLQESPSLHRLPPPQILSIEINCRVVLALHLIGQGLSDLEKFCGIINMPHQNTFIKHAIAVHCAAMQMARKAFKLQERK